MYKRLHDTLSESRKLGKISDFAFRCWTIALSKADWFGRLPADPGKFKAICFANRPSVHENEIMFALDELADVGGSGLIHLYQDVEAEKFLVFHKHPKSNPTGNVRNRVPKYPPPPRGLCRCLEFNQIEKIAKSIGGKEFRNFSGVFCNDRSNSCNGPCCSLLLSVEDKGGAGGEKGEADIGLICDEFTSLTGRTPLQGVQEPEEFLDRLRGLIRLRSIQAMLRVMREKTSDCVQKTGRPPSSLQYFIPIFEDDRLFKNPNQKGSGNGNDGTRAVLRHFGLPEGHFAAQIERRIAERERKGDAQAESGGQDQTRR